MTEGDGGCAKKRVWRSILQAHSSHPDSEYRCFVSPASVFLFMHYCCSRRACYVAYLVVWSVSGVVNNVRVRTHQNHYRHHQSSIIICIPTLSLSFPSTHSLQGDPINAYSYSITFPRYAKLIFTIQYSVFAVRYSLTLPRHNHTNLIQSIATKSKSAQL